MLFLKKKTIPILFLFCTLLSIDNFGEEKAEKSRGDEKASSLIILPVLFYTPETKIAFGVGGVYYFRTSGSSSNSRPSAISFAFIYTQNKQFIVETSPDLYLEMDKFHLTGSFNASKFPQKFYGIGNKAPLSQEEKYTSQSFVSEFSLQKKVLSSIYFGIQYEFERFKIMESKKGGLFSGESDSRDLQGWAMSPKKSAVSG